MPGPLPLRALKRRERRAPLTRAWRTALAGQINKSSIRMIRFSRWRRMNDGRDVAFHKRGSEKRRSKPGNDREPISNGGLAVRKTQNRKSRYETSHTVHPPSRKWRGYAGRENRTATSTLRSSCCGGRVNPTPKSSFRRYPILPPLRCVKKAISCQNHLRNETAAAAAALDAARRSASPIQLPDQ